MKSLRLVFPAHGKPADVLALEAWETPPLQDGQVLLAINAAPINPADLNFIEGTYGLKPELPAPAGLECSATVLESRSPRFSPGDAVVPLSPIGAWAEHAVAAADDLIPLPAGMDPLQASMLKVNPATAWALLHHFATLRAGDSVALNAANSGVGQCVIQLAAAMGVRTHCFVRDLAAAPYLTALGAFAVREDSPEGYGMALESLGTAKAKLAFNAVGGDSALRLMKLLENGATHITYGAMARKPLTIPNGALIFSDLRFRGLWVTKWIKEAPRDEVEAVYSQLSRRIVDGTLTQKVDSAFPLRDFKEALARLEAADRNGKILLRMGCEFAG